jgi:hypothetical protein
LHIKLEIVKKFFKEIDRNSPELIHLEKKFPWISDAEIKEGVFVGPQKKES